MLCKMSSDNSMFNLNEQFAYRRTLVKEYSGPIALCQSFYNLLLSNFFHVQCMYMYSFKCADMQYTLWMRRESEKTCQHRFTREIMGSA